MSFAAVFDHEQPQNFLYTFADREAEAGRRQRPLPPDGQTNGLHLRPKVVLVVVI